MQSFVSVLLLFFLVCFSFLFFPRMAREMCVSFYSARAHNVNNYEPREPCSPAFLLSPSLFQLSF